MTLSLGAIIIFLLILIIIGLVVSVFLEYRAHKRPLKQADPNVKYSMAHHIKKVTIPLVKYRITFTLEFANSRNIDKF